MKTKRPIRENLLRQLALAKEYATQLYQLQQEGCDCQPQIQRTEREIEKLEKLTK